LTPAAPGWMCATFAWLPAGKLFNDTLKSMVFAAELMVMTAVPRPVLSAFVIGGTSFCADSCTVKIVRLLGVVGELLPQPAAPIARILTAIANRFIAVLLMIRHVQNFRLKLKPM